MNKKRIFLIMTFFISCYLFAKFFEIDKVFTLENIKKNQRILKEFVNNNYLLSIVLFFLTYIVISSTPIPGDSILAISSGYLFGLLAGFIYTILAVTLGAIIAFLIFRFFINHNHFTSKRLLKLRDKIKESGAIYFLFLRVFPILPTSIINFLGALSPINIKTFIWTTFFGIMPISFIYVLSGTKLYKIKSISEILTIPIIFGFVFLIVAIFAPKFLKKFRKKRN